MTAGGAFAFKSEWRAHPGAVARRFRDIIRRWRTGHWRGGMAMTRHYADGPGWTVQRLLALIRDRECNPAVHNEVLALPLPPSWHKLFTRRRDQGQAEDWSARLRG